MRPFRAIIGCKSVLVIEPRLQVGSDGALGLGGGQELLHLLLQLELCEPVLQLLGLDHLPVELQVSEKIWISSPKLSKVILCAGFLDFLGLVADLAGGGCIRLVLLAGLLFVFLSFLRLEYLGLSIPIFICWNIIFRTFVDFFIFLLDFLFIFWILLW